MFYNCLQQIQHQPLQKEEQRIKIGNRNLIKVKLIGESNHGKAYQVQDLESKELFVMKSKEIMTKEEQDFTIKMKEHRFKNLVNVIDYDYDGNQHHIVMEKCEGDMLNLFINKNKKLTEESFNYVVREIATGIKELHDIGLVHRDIKPENIMIYKQIDQQTKHTQEIYKLGNFQLIKDIQGAKTMYQGTPYYLAPEQLGKSNKNYSYPVDIWAFGAVIYELCSQEILFQGKTIQEIYNKVQCQKIEPQINSLTINQDYKNLILQMLNRDPSKRLTIDKIIQELKPKLTPFKSVGVIKAKQEQSNPGFNCDNNTYREGKVIKKIENQQGQITQQKINVQTQMHLQKFYSQPGQIQQLNIQQQMNQQSKQIIKVAQQIQNENKKKQSNIIIQSKQNDQAQFFQKNKNEQDVIQGNTEKLRIQKKQDDKNQDNQTTIKKIIKIKKATDKE